MNGASLRSALPACLTSRLKSSWIFSKASSRVGFVGSSAWHQSSDSCTAAPARRSPFFPSRVMVPARMFESPDVDREDGIVTFEHPSGNEMHGADQPPSSGW